MNTTNTDAIDTPQAQWSFDKRSGSWDLCGPDGLPDGTVGVAVKRDGSRQAVTFGRRLRPCPWDCQRAFYAPGPKPIARETQAAWDSLDVPAGRYAVPSATGQNDLDFYRVDRPAEGKWAGYVFVRRIVGGQGDQRLRASEAADTCARIVRAGVRDSLAAYGHAIGECGVCGRTLTDEQSRAVGIGPVCAGRFDAAAKAACVAARQAA